MTSQFSPAWQRFFAQRVSAPAPAAPAPLLVAPASAAVPPERVVPPEWGVLARPAIGCFPTRRQAARDGGATSPLIPPAAGAAPPARPGAPVEQRPTPPEPPRRAQELVWLTWQMPERLREAVIVNLRQTLHWRAQYCGPLDAPEPPPEYTRFGLLGEQLVPIGALTVRKRLRAELRETIRTMETTQPRLKRNRLVAMHSARLGQLCAELEQRGINALEEVRGGLAWLWDEGAFPLAA